MHSIIIIWHLFFWSYLVKLIKLDSLQYFAQIQNHNRVPCINRVKAYISVFEIMLNITLNMNNEQVKPLNRDMTCLLNRHTSRLTPLNIYGFIV